MSTSVRTYSFAAFPSFVTETAGVCLQNNGTLAMALPLSTQFDQSLRPQRKIGIKGISGRRSSSLCIFRSAKLRKGALKHSI